MRISQHSCSIWASSPKSHGRGSAIPLPAKDRESPGAFIMAWEANMQISEFGF